MDFISQHWLDITGTIIGLIYIWQEYKASIWLWLTGIIMPLTYTVIYWDAGLYADFWMQIYYTLAAVYGFFAWMFSQKKSGKTPEKSIVHFPVKLVFPVFLLFIALWGILYWILIRYTNSNVPLLDSFGNALSIIGLWALTKKYLEQWWIWIVVDAELSALYVYKDIPFTAGLYALYVAIAIAGYRRWKKEMNSQTLCKENQNNA